MTNPLPNAKLRIPKGFQSLLVGLSTEVLRNQPKNIHAFAADYFEKLVQKREQGQSYLLDQQNNLEDRYYNNQSFQNQDLVNGPDENVAATKIQATFRGHKIRKDLGKSKHKQIIDPDQQELGYKDQHRKTSLDDAALIKQQRAATSIQAQFRGYQVRKQLHEKQQSLDIPATSIPLHGNLTADDGFDTSEHDTINRGQYQRESTDLSEDSERHTRIPRNSSFEREHQEKFLSGEFDMSDLNLDQAATRIQASYRGYKTRKELGTNPVGAHSSPSQEEFKNVLSPSAEGNKVPHHEEEDSAAAATKIQAAYRGYRVRKDMEK